MTTVLEKKYIPLANYFSSADNPLIKLTFDEIEQIMGQQLPNAAYLNRSWWKKTKAPAKHFHAWTDAGYHVSEVEINRYIIFKRTDSPGTDNANNKKGNGDILLIRAAEHGDARSLAALQKTVEAESDFMLYGKDERLQSTQKVRKQIIEWKQSGHSAIFIAILNGEHVGYLMLIGNTAERAAHRAEICLGVQSKAKRKGIASSLLKSAEEWAVSKGINRLELTVVKEDTPARRLFEKAHYESEGIRQNAMFINGQPYDEMYMAKFID